MQGNFLGLGLKNIVGLFILFCFMIVVLKVASLKWDKTPDGLRSVIQTL